MTRVSQEAQEAQEHHVVLETEGAVAWIRFNRPDKLNPIGALARDQLDAALKTAERDDAVRCLVLTGSGRAFSAGADVAELSSRTPEEIGRDLRGQYLNIVQRIRNMPKPVICGMNGLAAGIAASLAMACDIRIAADDAYFIEAFVNIGLGPDGGASWLLPRFVGRGKALEMFFTGRPLSAQEAERFGLVNRVVAKDEVEATCRALAGELAVGSRSALAAGKRAVNHAETAGFEDAVEFEGYLQEVQAAGADFQEGVAAFLAKRKPDFQKPASGPEARG
jgi:2-(1,2-epoxy-1,2-dihydrophenyl)acetyl-CoA isomerase